MSTTVGDALTDLVADYLERKGDAPVTGQERGSEYRPGRRVHRRLGLTRQEWKRAVADLVEDGRAVISDGRVEIQNP